MDRKLLAGVAFVLSSLPGATAASAPQSGNACLIEGTIMSEIVPA